MGWEGRSPISYVGKFMVLKVESSMFCFCFSYESATVCVLSVVLIKVYTVNSEHQILTLASFETIMG